MNFNELETHHQRRVILDVLALDSAHSQNNVILKSALKQVGHHVSSDKLLTELHWLQEQGLVKLDAFGGFTVANLTMRGLDIATGAITLPGVEQKGLPS